jgi:cation diffusion facilitator family transporter
MPSKNKDPLAPEASTKVVLAALAGNILVALSKFGAAGISGSSAMLTEAFHSSADSANQVLLLIGNKRSQARADAGHPFGYGMEIYFWTFVVAVMVLLVGGGASIYAGFSQLQSPVPITSPWVSLGVLVLSAVFDGISLAVGYRQYKRIVDSRYRGGPRVGLWKFIELSKDPNMYESLLEDSAALIGVGFAAIGVIANAFFDVLWADGAASLAIGLLLVANSLVIARATRSLMAGESAAPPLLRDIKRALEADKHATRVVQISTLQLGPQDILVALTVNLDRVQDIAGAKQIFDDLTSLLKSIDHRIAHVLFRVD